NLGKFANNFPIKNGSSRDFVSLASFFLASFLKVAFFVNMLFSNSSVATALGINFVDPSIWYLFNDFSYFGFGMNGIANNFWQLVNALNFNYFWFLSRSSWFNYNARTILFELLINFLNYLLKSRLLFNLNIKMGCIE